MVMKMMYSMHAEPEDRSDPRGEPCTVEYMNCARYMTLKQKANERDTYAYENSNLRDKKDDLSNIISQLLKAADVKTSADDLVGSSSLQSTVVNQIEEKLEQARGHGEVLDLYKQKTQEMERTLKELSELKNEVSGTRAEKEEAKRKIQEQEENIKKQQQEQKDTQTKYESVAQEMMKMQLKIERLERENKELKEESDDFKDIDELGAGEHVQPHNDEL